MKDPLLRAKTFSDQVGNTPLVELAFHLGDNWRTVHLKLEGYNPAGSSKDRTALGLMTNLYERGLLTKSSIIIESTSGNLGVSLAFICRELGYRFIAVIDPKTTLEMRQRLVSLGAELDLVGREDKGGGYLLTRLTRVNELCEKHAEFVWPDQYSNPANPFAHYCSTAPEIFSQMEGKVDAIFVAVSTGGTFAGIQRYCSEMSPSTMVVAVDALGSVVFGGVPGPRKLTGIGSSRESSFIQPLRARFHRVVSDSDAFSVCRVLKREVNFSVGGSSGAVVFACLQVLVEHPSLKHVVCVCPDGGDNYQSTIFSDVWMVSQGFDPKSDVGLIKPRRIDPDAA
jgi:2,3-diaminopropionate biosynthesis protein SbnA